MNLRELREKLVEHGFDEETEILVSNLDNEYGEQACRIESITLCGNSCDCFSDAEYHKRYDPVGKLSERVKHVLINRHLAWQEIPKYPVIEVVKS